MQKSKSFKKPVKSQKQLSYDNSRALLQISCITANSKDKSQFTNHLTERTFHHQENKDENQKLGYLIKNKSSYKPINGKKQSINKKNTSLSTRILRQIMDYSNSLNNEKRVNNENFIGKGQQILIFSKEDIKKNKALSQTKKSKKLLLCQPQNINQKTLLKSKSSYAQGMRGQSVLCSIKIHPIEQKCNESINRQKRQSFQKRRNSMNSSKRTSITLFQNQHEIPMDRLNRNQQYKRSKEYQKYQNNMDNDQKNKNNADKKEYTQCEDKKFMKKFNNIYSSSEKFDNMRAQQLFQQQQQGLRWLQNDKIIKQNNLKKQTKQNQTQISERQIKQNKQTLLLKLDQLNMIEQDIKRQAGKFLSNWDQLIMCEKDIHKYKQYLPQSRRQLQQIEKHSHKLNNNLLRINKQYLYTKRNQTYSFNSFKQNILSEVQKLHCQVKRKVFKKDLQDMMMFNMKVVLPSDMIESSISCFDQIDSKINNQHSSLINQHDSTLNNQHSSLMNQISIYQLYQQLMRQKASKKYGMILKKQINNMNMYDIKTMNEYLKKLYQLQLNFNKITSSDPNSQTNYLNQIQTLIQDIQCTNSKLEQSRFQHNKLEHMIDECLRNKQYIQREIQNLLVRTSEDIFQQYKSFKTGKVCNQLDTSLSHVDVKESDQTIEQFRQLLINKYKSIYQKYKHIQQQKINLCHLFNSFN